MDSIIEYKPQSIISGIDDDVIAKLNEFSSNLNTPPEQKNLRTNKFANNAKYLPISFLEMKLDEITLGAWQTSNFSFQTIANEIVGSLELKFFHPILKQWLCRIGAGAVQIQMTSTKNGGSGDITDIKQKIINTLAKDFPHLKAECFRNACLSIGKAFGRDLNREFTAEFNEFWTDKIDALQVSELRAIAVARKLSKAQIDSILEPHGLNASTISDMTKDLFELIKNDFRTFGKSNETT